MPFIESLPSLSEKSFQYVTRNSFWQFSKQQRNIAIFDLSNLDQPGDRNFNFIPKIAKTYQFNILFVNTTTQERQSIPLHHASGHWILWITPENYLFDSLCLPLIKLFTIFHLHHLPAPFQFHLIRPLYHVTNNQNLALQKYSWPICGYWVAFVISVYYKYNMYNCSQLHTFLLQYFPINSHVTTKARTMLYMLHILLPQLFRQRNYM